jgi:hypothetical protein
VAVPPSAVSERAGVFRVYVVADERAEARIVQVVERSDERVLVEGEIAAGDSVVTAPPRELADGARVQR